MTASQPAEPTPSAPDRKKAVTGVLVGLVVVLYLFNKSCGHDDHKSTTSSTTSSYSSTYTPSSTSAFAAPPAPATPIGPVMPKDVTFNTEPGSDGENVFAQFRISDALLMSFTKSLARHKTIEILKYAHQTYPDASQVTVTGTFPTKDAYGNSQENTVVLNVSYLKSTLDKINFDGIDSDKICGLRDSGTVHPELQG